MILMATGLFLVSFAVALPRLSNCTLPPSGTALGAIPTVSADPRASCGPVSLSVVSRLLGRPEQISEFNRLTGADALGLCSMLDLRNALKARGFVVEAVRLDSGVRTDLVDPVILHFRKGHFCAALPVDMDRLIIIDPPKQPEVMTYASLSQDWDGAALIVRNAHHGRNAASPESVTR
jgi:ABC-type bacteriocin/lantibiotic exporter with double-glycine peptidase domain